MSEGPIVFIGTSFLVGRTRGMFISGGQNVYPAEIEAVQKSHRGLAGAAVLCWRTW